VLGQPVPTGDPIGPPYAGGTSSLPWHPHGAPLSFVPPVLVLSPQTQLWQGASPAPQQSDPGDPPPGEAWWDKGGAEGFGEVGKVSVGADRVFWGQCKLGGSCSSCNQGTPRGRWARPPGVPRASQVPLGMLRVGGGTAKGMGATGRLPELAPLCLQAGGWGAAPLRRALRGCGTPAAGLGGGAEGHGRGQPPSTLPGQGTASRGDVALLAGMWGGMAWRDPLPLWCQYHQGPKPSGSPISSPDIPWAHHPLCGHRGGISHSATTEGASHPPQLKPVLPFQLVQGQLRVRPCSLGSDPTQP